MFFGESGNILGFVADNAKRMLEDDGVRFATVDVFWLIDTKCGGINVGINGFEVAGNDGVDGGDASVWLSDDFAATVDVVNSLEANGHT